MSDKDFNFDEFMQVSTPPEAVSESETIESAELDIQKAVVEDFAAEKVELVAKNDHLAARLVESEQVNQELQRQIAALKEEIAAKDGQIAAAAPSLEAMRRQLDEAKAQIAAAWNKFEDDTVRNPNAIALLDRDGEMPDRFIGETRDLILEIVKQARDAAEQANQARRIQLLESVLVANEPNGTRAKRREEVEKLLKDNGYLINAAVIEKLKQFGLTHKNGATYLTASEIIEFNF